MEKRGWFVVFVILLAVIFMQNVNSATCSADYSGGNCIVSLGCDNNCYYASAHFSGCDEYCNYDPAFPDSCCTCSCDCYFNDNTECDGVGGEDNGDCEPDEGCWGGYETYIDREYFAGMCVENSQTCGPSLACTVSTHCDQKLICTATTNGATTIWEWKYSTYDSLCEFGKYCNNNYPDNCNDIYDNDCDGFKNCADNNCKNSNYCECIDEDNDGFGKYPNVNCPRGLIVDCNDNDANEQPGQNWYKDQDNDVWSDGTKLVRCTRPSGYKTHVELSEHISGDCNDGNPAIHPGATEINCNGLDDDCIGGDACGTPCTDSDGDKYNQSAEGCGTPDCNDGNPAIHPGATEIECDGIDQDCDFKDYCLCRLDKIFWIDIDVPVKEPAYFFLNGTHCENSYVDFSVLEWDGQLAGANSANPGPARAYFGGKNNITSFWRTIWINDSRDTGSIDPTTAGNPPDYKIFSYPDSSYDPMRRINSSNLLRVNCTPDCNGRECGYDPVCGSSCGICPPPEICVESEGVCVNNSDGKCEIFKVTWWEDTAVNGSSTIGVIHGDLDCIQKRVNITIQEFDATGSNDTVTTGYSLNRLIQSRGDGKTTIGIIPWNPVLWQDDSDGDGGNPEFFFNATVYNATTGQIVSRNESGQGPDAIRLLTVILPECAGIDSYKDYPNEEMCENNACFFNYSEINPSCGLSKAQQCLYNLSWVSNCRFEWTGGSNGQCGFLTNYSPCDTTNPLVPPNLGTCLRTENGTSIGCDNNLGYYFFSWAGIWTPGHSGLNQAQCESNFGIGNCSLYDGLWYYDPDQLIEGCEEGGTTMIECPVNADLPFFGVWQMMAAVLAIAVVYFFLEKRKVSFK